MPAGKPQSWFFVPVMALICLGALVVYGSYLANLSAGFTASPPAADAGAVLEYQQAIKYATGDGVAPDRQKAIDLLTQSAEHGFSEAQILLADAYYHGELDQDYQKAYVWFAVATHNGLARAAALRYEVAAHLSPAELEAAQQEVEQRLAKLP